MMRSTQSLTAKTRSYLTNTPFRCIEEKFTYSLSELEDIYQTAWDKGYQDAMTDMHRSHNQHVEYGRPNKVPKCF